MSLPNSVHGVPQGLGSPGYASVRAELTGVISKQNSNGKQSVQVSQSLPRKRKAQELEDSERCSRSSPHSRPSPVGEAELLNREPWDEQIQQKLYSPLIVNEVEELSSSSDDSMFTDAEDNIPKSNQQREWTSQPIDGPSLNEQEDTSERLAITGGSPNCALTQHSDPEQWTSTMRGGPPQCKILGSTTAPRSMTGSCDEASDAVKLLVKTKEEDPSWPDIRQAWEAQTGQFVASSTLPSRYARAEDSSQRLHEGDAKRLLDAEQEVEAEFERQKWSLVGNSMMRAGSMKYSKAFIEKQFKALSRDPEKADAIRVQPLSSAEVSNSQILDNGDVDVVKTTSTRDDVANVMKSTEVRLSAAPKLKKGFTRDNNVELNNDPIDQKAGPKSSLVGAQSIEEDIDAGVRVYLAAVGSPQDFGLLSNIPSNSKINHSVNKPPSTITSRMANRTALSPQPVQARQSKLGNFPRGMPSSHSENQKSLPYQKPHATHEPHSLKGEIAAAAAGTASPMAQSTISTETSISTESFKHPQGPHPRPKRSATAKSASKKGFRQIISRPNYNRSPEAHNNRCAAMRAAWAKRQAEGRGGYRGGPKVSSASEKPESGSSPAGFLAQIQAAAAVDMTPISTYQSRLAKPPSQPHQHALAGSSSNDSSERVAYPNERQGKGERQLGKQRGPSNKASGDTSEEDYMARRHACNGCGERYGDYSGLKYHQTHHPNCEFEFDT